MDDINACKEAAKHLNQNFEITKNEADWPKGCYFSDEIHFNPHSTGSSNNNSRQICKRRDKTLGLHLFIHYNNTCGYKRMCQFYWRYYIVG